jgi:hypothetical protein
MSKWSTTELLCNSRGLDDGYLYVHVENPLGERLQEVKVKTGRRSLGDPARWGGFSGSIQHPLSNEQVNPGECIEPPKISSNAESLADLASPLRENRCICAAFTEPLKRPHMSVLLMGAILPPPTLLSTDFVTRRPCLNFGGLSIANLGGFSLDGQSVVHGLGHGSIRSAQQFSQLGHQVYSAVGVGHPLFQPPRPPNTTGNSWPQPPQPPNFYRGPQTSFGHSHQQPMFQPSLTPQYGANQLSSSSVTQTRQQGNPQYNSSKRSQQQSTQHSSNVSRPASFNQPQFIQQQGIHASTQPPLYPQGQPIQSVPLQQGSGATLSTNRVAYSFNRQGGPNQRQAYEAPSNLPRSSSSQPVNSTLMSSLRSQLVSTLQQNRRQQDSGDRR